LKIESDLDHWVVLFILLTGYAQREGYNWFSPCKCRVALCSCCWYVDWL